MSHCSCFDGVRCSEAERLWRVRARALEDYQRDLNKTALKMAFKRADKAYTRHVEPARWVMLARDQQP